MEGIITHIQRMSIHDGPGIRSTIFLKGCNFRCKWCHNPETWSSAPQLQHSDVKCVKCHTCVQICPLNAVSINSDMTVAFNRGLCNKCGMCTDNCVGEAIKIVGETISAEEAFRRAAIDKEFFAESGGGITVSGGEPLMQPDFTKEILELCKTAGIGTALETNLSCDEHIIRSLTNLVGLWMCDLKAFDDDLHISGTGCSNIATLRNLKLLSESGAKAIVRTPVIPGYNYDIQELMKIRNFAENLGFKHDILRFHTFGYDKFDSLGMRNPMDGADELSRTKFDEIQSLLDKN